MAAAAYRSGKKLHSEYYGEDSDYTRKGGMICSEILLPSHAPPSFADRETLWNEVKKAGRVAVCISKDLSRLGRNSALTGLYTNFTFPQYGVRYIAINDNFDTVNPNSTDNDFAGIKNWFNEFYARDTSRKIRAVQKSKGERGVPLTVNVPYGYLKDPENPRRWVVDPVAADVVKRIFAMYMEGRGPQQIANQLKADKVLTPTAYKAQQGIKCPNKKPENPYGWKDSSVVNILERREYTGCTVNFKTYTNSIWDKKQRENPIERQAIFPNMHERIIDDDVFEADKTSDNGAERTFRCQFNLKSLKYSNTATYYLVIADEQGLQMPQREPFQIDIAFAVDEFDFFS